MSEIERRRANVRGNEGRSLLMREGENEAQGATKMGKEVKVTETRGAKLRENEVYHHAREYGV